MTKNVLEETKCKDFSEQTKIVAGFRQKTGIAYEVPHIIEATVCLFMIHASTGTRLYLAYLQPYTRCQEAYEERQLLAVGFDANHLDIIYGNGFIDLDLDTDDEIEVGVAGVLKLF